MAVDIAALIQIYQQAQAAIIQTILAGKSVAFKNEMLREVNQTLATLQKKTVEWVEDQIPQAYKDGMAAVNADYARQWGDKGIPVGQYPSEFSVLNKRAIAGLVENAKSDLLGAVRFVGRQVRDDIRRIGLQAVTAGVASGQTWKQVASALAAEYQKNGVSALKYSRGGKTCYMSMDAYSALVARSTTREATNVATFTQTEEFGSDLVKMSSHSGACPICAVLEGRVYSISGSSTKYPHLSRAFRGDHANIHPNCGHVLRPYFEDLQDDETLARNKAFSSRPFDPEKMAPEDRARYEQSVELYHKKQSYNRQLYSDRKQWQEYRALFPDDTPKTLSGFRRMKAAGSDRWTELQAKRRTRKKYARSELTREDAIKWAYDRNIDATYKTIPLKVINRVHTQLEMLEDKWGVQFREIVERVYDAADAGTYASAQMGRLSLSKKYFGNPDAFEAELQDGVKKKWHPDGTGNLEAVVAHEYGHLLEEWLPGALRTELQNQWTAYRRATSALKGPLDLSNYARTSYDEFVAEAFSEYSCSPAPRSWAKGIGKIFEQMLDGW